jgi:hypothetical protein
LNRDEMAEIRLVREAYELGIFSVYGNDPYTIELILLTHAWMRTRSAEKPNNTHLWGFVKSLAPEIPVPPDVTYRDRMRKLWKADVVEGIEFYTGKFDYVLTEYGEAVYKEHTNSLGAQIRLKKWRQRALRDTKP